MILPAGRAALDGWRVPAYSSLISLYCATCARRHEYLMALIEGVTRARDLCN